MSRTIKDVSDRRDRMAPGLTISVPEAIGLGAIIGARNYALRLRGKARRKLFSAACALERDWLAWLAARGW